MESDLAFTLANFAALAVKNARLYRTGQKYAAELEQTLAERKKAEVEREKLRQQLVQTQKMDAIGQLAGGIAHDFNNMLSGIIGNAELVYNSTSDSALREYAGDIITIGKRSAELTTQLLAFSRKGQVQNSTVDLHKVLQEIASILRHTISRNITIKTEFEADNFHTRGDPTQIQSALLNLAVNARDAMFQGGVIEFRTRCTMPDVKQWPLCTFELKPETYIEITVRDNGIGMSAETLEHIYEPFFTTKSQGEGTGLGLSAVYGTMKSHQGAICVESSPGQGTTFRLYFPLEQKIDTAERESEPLKESSFSGGNSIANSQKRILIIDDEEMVAKAAAGHLRKAGFEVILFTDSTECLDFFKDSHPTISLVILDIIMPKMDGKELFYALKAINPDLPVILSSGFSVNGTAQTLLDDGAQLFIPKPFQREDLLHAIDKVLG
jgi:signal transduction histidine kinase/CheY-like chemotaxis protein